MSILLSEKQTCLNSLGDTEQKEPGSGHVTVHCQHHGLIRVNQRLNIIIRQGSQV